MTDSTTTPDDALAKLAFEIESSVAHNQCGDADDLAKAIDNLIVQRINQIFKHIHIPVISDPVYPIFMGEKHDK